MCTVMLTLGRRPPEEAKPNAHLPPSTIAAQIVDDHLTQGRIHPKHQDREKFRRLLGEILHTDENSQDSNRLIETNNDVNCRLIYVVIRAGLELSLSDDPFEKQDDLITQALESLSVVELTLQRCPDVLFSILEGRDSDPQLDGHLFLWLLPRLFILLGRSKDNKIHLGILNVLRTILITERRCRPQKKPQLILQYMQGCIKDLLFYVEEPLQGAGSFREPLVPTMATITEVSPLQPGQDHVRSPVQVSVQDTAEASMIILCLLSTINSFQSHGSSHMSTPGLDSLNISWTLRCLMRLWNTFSCEKFYLTFGQLSEQYLLMFLQILCDISAQLSRVSYETINLIRTSILTSKLTAALLLMDLAELTDGLQKAICLAILEILCRFEFSSILVEAFDQHLLPIVVEITESASRLLVIGKDLQQTLHLVLRIRHIGTESGKPPHTQTTLFEDNDVQQVYDRNFNDFSHTTDREDDKRPHKRVRLSVLAEHVNCGNLQVDLLRSLRHLLGSPEEAEFNISEDVIDRFPLLSEEDQSTALSILGRLSCAWANTLSGSMVPTRGQVLYHECSICDVPMKIRRTSTAEHSDSSGLVTVVENLIELTQKAKSRRPRIAALLATRRLLTHLPNTDELDLSKSGLGQWCLKYLRSSSRDLRIAAGRTIPVFLQDGLEERVLSKNRVSVLDFLRTLSETSELGIQETCILAWAQIARVSYGDEMNIVLLRLVEYFGHSNPLVCGIAFEEIQKITKHDQYLVKQLFMPYWGTVAPTVVKDLYRRPQIAQYMSDLLGMSVDEFLVLTQVYTVPYFVLTKKREILQKIAQACGQSIGLLCMDRHNMDAILTCILLHPSDDMESIYFKFLVTLSSEFKDVRWKELIWAQAASIASELLKVAGEGNHVKGRKAHAALAYLAQITHGQSGSGRGTLTSDSIGPFFETHALGIMAQLSDTINDGKEPQPVSEKNRCLRAVREMVLLAKNHISHGLPQISACLRSAIENRELCNSAFTAWITMLDTLGEDEIGILLDPTFAIIAQYWESFDPHVQEQAYAAVSKLLKSHAGMVRDAVKTIPSLASIPLMSKFEEELGKIKAQIDIKHQFQAFSQRCQNENVTVVIRALTELESYLTQHQRFLHDASMHEQPDPIVGELIRSILDSCVLLGEFHSDISLLGAKCLGLIGCVDPTRVETIRDNKEMLVLHNFDEAEETKDFVVFLCREVLVKAFLSATNTKFQGFLAWAMQELLKFIQFDTSVMVRSRDVAFDGNYTRWAVLPELVKNTLTPFLTSQYVLTARAIFKPLEYPLYSYGKPHRVWLGELAHDLLQKGAGENVQGIFPVLCRIVRSDTSIADFLLPFAALNVVVSGIDKQVLETAQELLAVLNHALPDLDPAARDSIIVCSQTVFHVLDYFSRWMQAKRKEVAHLRIAAAHNSREAMQSDYGIAQIQRIEKVLNMFPAEVISRRAVECKSYARALFHWEQYIRQRKNPKGPTQVENMEPLYERLQDIYTQIDEPDGIEGISAHLQVLNIDQQILEHRKAGRWTAAQSWYELLLTEKPNDLDVQFNLLISLKESGQHDVLLNQIDGFQPSQESKVLSLPFAAEASWVTGKWGKLRQYLSLPIKALGGDFNVRMGGALLALSQGDLEKFSEMLNALRHLTAQSLSTTNTASLQACHEAMLKFHAITEVEAISRAPVEATEKLSLLSSLDRRLDLLGAFVSDKQYLLGLRRAAMQLSNFPNIDIASAWLTTAKLARKGNFTHSAFNAVLHASRLGDVSATIEHSRLLWREGHHRKAIQSLEGAIAANAFRSADYTQPGESMVPTVQGSKLQQQNLVKAKAYLMLAKWVDRAGQIQSDIIISQYKNALESCNRWEKGHYYLGKHYNKLLESEKAKAPGKQAQTFITGETAKLVIENYLRSLAFGAKYIYQTLPRILTLWLELGSDAEQPLDPKYGNDEDFRTHATTQRQKMLNAVNTQVKKYVDRLPPFTWYTAFSQIVARICQSNTVIYNLLAEIVTKVVITHPQQALWTLLAMLKSSKIDRSKRGSYCLSKILEFGKSKKSSSTEIMTLIAHAQKLSDQLLRVCEGEIHGKPTMVNISKDLGFNHKTAPCRIAIPIEAMLTASLPTATESVNMKTHKAFPKDIVTISSFLDEVLVLNSLQRPRKISIRGSDGHVYALLCKPKDDLRKDQRLMEFNAMINRALKKDASCSKRRLYIKTYAVTPLNEECGLIEWIDKLKTLRDILIGGYKEKNVPINYGDLRALLTKASATDKSQVHIFTDVVLGKFPPIFHEWFIEQFPSPESWFPARLRYARSCAVMSVVGHVLGLGDRHGENVLFEETNGGTFHVDFNCLFDKGLTFDKPELVPFRLTQNMIDAFGAYGYEGPFRKSCELTLSILRQHEDTLMTILETFLYDPTTDFIGHDRKKRIKQKNVVILQQGYVVPDTPEGVLESVRNKVRGLLPLESVPLSVEGHVQELLSQATDPWRLASMYIGWCAFF